MCLSARITASVSTKFVKLIFYFCLIYSSYKYPVPHQNNTISDDVVRMSELPTQRFANKLINTSLYLVLCENIFVSISKYILLKYSKSKAYVMQHAKTRLFSLKWDPELLYYSARVCVFSFINVSRPHQSRALHIGK